jgi:hypothetical protein
MLNTLKNHPRYELNVYMKSIYINNFYQVLVEVSAFEMSWATFCYPSWYNSIYRDLGNIKRTSSISYRIYDKA